MPGKKSKSRIAVFGLGAGALGEGIPVITDLFERLSGNFEITFYSHSPASLSRVPNSIRVRQLISKRLPWRIRYLFLFLRAVADHFFKSYSLIFSVSVYPSGPFALRLGKILRVPVLIQLIATEAVDLEEIGCESLTSPWLKRLTREVCAKADFLVTVSDYQKQVALRTLSTTRTIEVLPLRVEPEKFAYKKRNVSTPVEFIQVAYYSPIKDQDTLFKAFAIVAGKIDCRLTVVGKGFDSSEVLAKLVELKIQDKVKCIGFLSPDELKKYYDRADILLHAARFETGCAVIQEAMASGVAVCGTNVGLLADIGEEYAVVVPIRSPERMASAILDLVADPQKFDRITSQAYAWITSHDGIWSASQYESFFDKIIGNRPA